MDHSFYDILQPWCLQMGIRKGHLWKQKGIFSLFLFYFLHNCTESVILYNNKLFFLWKVFKGNSDSHGIHHSYLEHPVDARFVRIHVVDWHNHPSLRMELIGCQGNKSKKKILTRFFSKFKTIRIVCL
jgi:hypothetical protein